MSSFISLIIRLQDVKVLWDRAMGAGHGQPVYPRSEIPPASISKLIEKASEISHEPLETFPSPRASPPVCRLARRFSDVAPEAGILRRLTRTYQEGTRAVDFTPAPRQPIRT